MKRKRTLLLHLLLLCSACSSVEFSAPANTFMNHVIDHDVEGSWGENNHGEIIPGNSFVLSLFETNGVITGSGSFAFEAGPYGPLIPNGTVAHDTVALRIIYDFQPSGFVSLKPDTVYFNGVLTNSDQIDGRLTRRGVTTDFSLIRLRIGDPPR